MTFYDLLKAHWCLAKSVWLHCVVLNEGVSSKTIKVQLKSHLVLLLFMVKNKTVPAFFSKKNTDLDIYEASDK